MFVRSNAQMITADVTIFTAATLKRLGRLDEALTELQTAEDLGGSVSAILAEKGEIYERKLDYGMAAQQYKRYIDASETEFEKANVYMRLGICYDRLERMDELRALIQLDDYKTSAIFHFGAIARTISWGLRLNIPPSLEWVREGLEQAKIGGREEAIDAVLLLMANPEAGDVTALANFLSNQQVGAYGRDGIDFLAKYSFRNLLSRLARSERFVSVEKAIASVVCALTERRAFSLVRLGDGEGNFVGSFLDKDNSFLARQRALSYSIWFGCSPSANDAGMLFDKLSDIIPEVDVLGVPDQARLALELKRVPRGYFGVYMAAEYSLQTAKANAFVTREFIG